MSKTFDGADARDQMIEGHSIHEHEFHELTGHELSDDNQAHDIVTRDNGQGLDDKKTSIDLATKPAKARARKASGRAESKKAKSTFKLSPVAKDLSPDEGRAFLHPLHNVLETPRKNPYLGAKQTTLAGPLRLEGVGVHSGAPVAMTLFPAGINQGITFSVTSEKGDVAIKAHRDFVDNVTLCTVLASQCGAAVATVEHLMAALRGLSVDNVLIEINNGEVPIMDGSAMPFVRAIDQVGIRELDAPRRFIKVLKPIYVEENGCWGELLPHNGFHLEVEIDFKTPVIGRQKFSSDMNPGIFREELAKARTFGFMADVKGLWAAGRALGASLDNTVAIDDDKIVNAEGLRFKDEFVRHKALDAVGDLALAGYPLLCSYRSYRGGHALNAKVLEALFADEDAWIFVDAPQIPPKVYAEPKLRLDQTSGAAIMTAANFAADRN